MTKTYLPEGNWWLIHKDCHISCSIFIVISIQIKKEKKQLQCT